MYVRYINIHKKTKIVFDKTQTAFKKKKKKTAIVIKIYIYPAACGHVFSFFKFSRKYTIGIILQRIIVNSNFNTSVYGKLRRKKSILTYCFGFTAKTLQHCKYFDFSFLLSPATIIPVAVNRTTNGVIEMTRFFFLVLVTKREQNQ